MEVVESKKVKVSKYGPLDQLQGFPPFNTESGFFFFVSDSVSHSSLHRTSVSAGMNSLLWFQPLSADYHVLSAGALCVVPQEIVSWGVETGVHDAREGIRNDITREYLPIRM